MRVGVLVIHSGHRCQPATGDAAYGFKRRLQIARRAGTGKLQVAQNAVQHAGCAAHVASSAETDLDYMAAARYQTERTVERRNVIDLSQRHAQLLRDFSQYFLGQIPVGLLYVLKDWD